jgi:NADH-quinone oxidoreductase subunit F
MSATLVLLKNRRPGETVFLSEYQRAGGYQALQRTVGKTEPAAIRAQVQESGLRGRGGAGFPTGKKWSFFPSDAKGEKYLVCNADEMEPATYKDRVLLEADPHQLLEGMALSAYALGIPVGYIFIRYAYENCARNLERAIAEATQAGLLGDNILGSDFSFELRVHRSAGRYILGEESALLNGLEGIRPNPRLRPPFPAQRGLFGRPTTVQNVETLSNVPHIVQHGSQWFHSLSLVAEGAGTKLFGLSGHLNRTECFELPMGTPLRQVVEEAGGGIWKGRRFKACQTGGASTPFLREEHLDVPMDFNALEKVGGRLGTACVTVFDDRTCMVRATVNLIRFFTRESCGWCTPCREGLPFVGYLLQKIEDGQGTPEDVAILKRQIPNINQSFCALAIGAMEPLASLLRLFEEEVLAHIQLGRCPLGS